MTSKRVPLNPRKKAELKRKLSSSSSLSLLPSIDHTRKVRTRRFSRISKISERNLQSTSSTPISRLNEEASPRDLATEESPFTCETYFLSRGSIEIPDGSAEPPATERNFDMSYKRALELMVSGPVHQFSKSLMAAILEECEVELKNGTAYSTRPNQSRSQPSRDTSQARYCYAQLLWSNETSICSCHDCCFHQSCRYEYTPRVCEVYLRQRNLAKRFLELTFVGGRRHNGSFLRLITLHSIKFMELLEDQGLRLGSILRPEHARRSSFYTSFVNHDSDFKSLGEEIIINDTIKKIVRASVDLVIIHSFLNNLLFSVSTPDGQTKYCLRGHPANTSIYRKSKKTNSSMKTNKARDSTVEYFSHDLREAQFHLSNFLKVHQYLCTKLCKKSISCSHHRKLIDIGNLERAISAIECPWLSDSTGTPRDDYAKTLLTSFLNVLPWFSESSQPRSVDKSDCRESIPDFNYTFYLVSEEPLIAQDEPASPYDTTVQS